MTLNKRIIMLVYIILCLNVSGCSLLKVAEQSDAVGTTGIIKGVVTVSGSQKGTVIVLRYRDENGNPVLVSQKPVSAEGDYLFHVIPGKYFLAAFVDYNNDGLYQDNELGSIFGAPDSILVPARESVMIEPIIISGLVPKLNASESIHSIEKNIGRVISMNDPSFTRDNYAMGMFRPTDFLAQVGGGLFFLQPFEPDKIPVLFIHGISGGPTDWQSAIDSLDKNKYQPWILYYPSGFRLDTISDYLLRSVVSMHNKYRFDQFYVVAHSMGGLVTRSFVKKIWEQFPDISKKLKLVMTVNSPMGGMASAAVGVKYSPIVISAWHDVAPGSAFLQTIYGWVWPEEIPYFLVFSFKTEDNGDGVVSLGSQIPLRLQLESARMYGFNNDHVGTLNDSDFLALFNKLLDGSLN